MKCGIFLGALPYVQLNNKMRVAMVSSWASNGQKGEKLSLFAHLWPRVTFNIPLYNMTQLWCEWSHWFYFWFACRPLAPAFSNANFGTAGNSLVAKWRITGKKARNFEIVLFQLWAALGEVFIEMWNFSWCTSLCPAKQQDEGGDGQFLSFERAERWEIVAFCPFVPTCHFQHTSL